MIGSYPSFSSLVPTQKYYYQTGDEKYGWSEEYSFRAPPTPSPDVTTRVIVFGDMGHAEKDSSAIHWPEGPSLNTTALVTADLTSYGVDVVLHIGDIRYIYH